MPNPTKSFDSFLELRRGYCIDDLSSRDIERMSEIWQINTPFLQHFRNIELANVLMICKVEKEKDRDRKRDILLENQITDRERT